MGRVADYPNCREGVRRVPNYLLQREVCLLFDLADSVVVADRAGR